MVAKENSMTKAQQKEIEKVVSVLRRGGSVSRAYGKRSFHLWDPQQPLCDFWVRESVVFAMLDSGVLTGNIFSGLALKVED